MHSSTFRTFSGLLEAGPFSGINLLKEVPTGNAHGNLLLEHATGTHTKRSVLLHQIQRIGDVKEALSVLMLCTPVSLFTSGSSAPLGRPRCGLLIWLSLLPYSIHFSELVPIFSKENRQNTKIQDPPCLYDAKMAADGYWMRKALILRELALIEKLFSFCVSH